MLEYVGMQREKQQNNENKNLEEIKQKIVVKEGKLKRYRDSIKTEKNILNNERKFYQQGRREITKTYQQTIDKETTILEQNMRMKRILQKSRIDKPHGKRFTRTQKRS